MTTLRSGGELAVRLKADMNKVLSRAPKAVARIAINFTEDNFEKGGFQTSQSGITKWPPRKHDDGSGRGVLIGKQSGRLMKSITEFQATEKAVIIGVPDNIAEYGRIHNEGGTTHPKVTDKMRKFAWFKYRQSDKKGDNWNSKGKDKFWLNLALTKKSRLDVKIPKRQFLGNSPELNRRIKVFFHDTFSRTLKGTITIK